MTLVSIIVPVYFNATSLPLLWERLKVLANRLSQYKFEFIFVDDGSGDDSSAIIQNLAKTDPRIKAVRLVRNFGSNAAILAGLSLSNGDCTAFVAADLQDPPESLDEMINQWEHGSKMVLAVRKNRLGDPFLTRQFARLFNFLFSHYVFHGYSPEGVGFFLVDRQVVDAVLQCEERNAHLIGLLLWLGFPYTTVQYDRIEREHGRSRWTFQRKIKFFIDAFAGFSYLPLRIASTIGLLLAGVGALYALFVFLARLLGDIPIEGWSALMIVFLVVSGTQLVMLGVIGEYLWRNLEATRKRPIFLIDHVFQLDQ
jgi:glycosyltransferase involved in cell wall biosynthesis